MPHWIRLSWQDDGVVLLRSGRAGLAIQVDEGSHNHPARDARALAQSRISLLLALEVAPTGRATADRGGAARLDPADEHRKSAFGPRHASTANCSSSGLRSRSRASPSTWSSGVGRQAKDGVPFCVFMRRALQPWTYSLSQRTSSVPGNFDERVRTKCLSKMLMSASIYPRKI